MKYCLLLISITLTLSVSAQFDFRFYTQAGANYSTIRIPRTTGIETSNGGYGWQLGAGTEYHTKFGYFVYLSAAIRSETFSKDSSPSHRPDTVAQFKYNPLFVSFPIGVGWQCSLTKKIDLKLYGGLDIQIGVAGKVKRRDLFYTRDSLTQQPVLARSSTEEHKLRYGRNSQRRYAYDLANSNWGAQIGTGINFNNSFEVNLFYHHGFTNFLPNRDAAVEINKLSFFEVNAKVYFPNNFTGSKKRVHNGY